MLPNLFISLAYYAIGIALIYWIRKGQILPSRWIFLPLSACAIASGTTHLTEVGRLWDSQLWIVNLTKTVAASIVLLSAVKLWRFQTFTAQPIPVEIDERLPLNAPPGTTDIKRSTEEFSWQGTLLQAIANASPLAVYAVDKHTDAILCFNHRFCELWGIGHLAEKMQRGELKNSDLTLNYLSILANIQTSPESCQPPQTDKTRIFIEDEITLMDGRTLCRYSTQIQDTAERHLGQLYLFEEKVAHPQSEEAIALADFSIERSAVPMAWMDGEARIIRTNTALCQLLGYSREELLCLHVWDIDPNFSPEIWSDRWQTFKQQKNLSLTSKPHRKDGKPISAEVTLSYLEFKGKEYSFACIQDIGERERTEAALRASEARFQAFMDHSPAAAWITDGNGQILYLSQSYTRMFKVPNSYSVGKTEMTIYPKDLRQEYLKNIRKVVETGQVVEAIEPAPRPDGLMGEFLVYKFPLPSLSGDVLVGGVAIDLTERKRAEAALQQREQEFRALVENAPDIIMRLNRDFRYLYINPAVEKHMGVPASAFIGKSLDEFGAPDSLTQLWKTTIEQVYETGEEQLIEFESFSVKGLSYYASRIVPEFDNNGSVKSVLGIARDISDRKRAEEALQRSESRFKHLTASIPGMVYTLVQHPDGSVKFEYLSPGCEEILEFPAEQILEDATICFNQFHPDDRSGYQEAMDRNLQTLDLFSYEWRLISPSGTIKWIQARAQPERGEDGSIAWYGVAADVSDRKQAEARLQQALAAAEAASIAKSRFLSNMSHELRTPLNAILGFSQVMARSDSLSSDHKEQLQIINRSGEHLLDLINNILSMAKIESGQIALNEHTFDLPQLLSEVVQMLRLKAMNKGVLLNLELKSDLPQFVEADEGKLRQVLINLLGNAIKFTQKGSVILRAQAKTKFLPAEEIIPSNVARSTAQLRFEVADTGPGIAPEELAGLFRPFIQTETGRQSLQGTGLGLPISQQYVQMMGGNITVSSQVGQGTCFSFDIRVKEVAGGDRHAPATPQRIVGLAPDQPTYRILVVEDVEENRLLLLKLLEPLGFQVRQASNGLEAISIWASWKPHLIWMDMRMPVLDGYEATRQIKAKERQQKIGDWGLESIYDRLKKQSVCLQDRGESSELQRKIEGQFLAPDPLQNSSLSETVIIALTASAFEEERATILSAGCDDLVRKPFQETVLLEKMAQYLGVRYIYEEEELLVLSGPITLKELIPEDLSVMPSEWIAQLHQAVICANDPLIFQLIEQIPTSHSDLAEALADLVNNFRLDLLFDLTQMYHNG